MIPTHAYVNIPHMPIIKSAQKKMRKDKKLTAHNAAKKINLKNLIKQIRKNPSPAVFQQLQSSLDKAVKTNLMHANKAARLKSRLSKITEPVKISTKKVSKKKAPIKKTSPKKK